MLSFFPLTSDLVEFIACFSKLTRCFAQQQRHSFFSRNCCNTWWLGSYSMPWLSSQILYLLSALLVQGEHQCKAGDWIESMIANVLFNPSLGTERLYLVLQKPALLFCQVGSLIRSHCRLFLSFVQSGQLWGCGWFAIGSASHCVASASKRI